jgi:hypothetical protein
MISRHHGAEENMPVLKLFPCEGNGGSPLVDGAGNIVGIGKFKASKALGKCCH